MVMGAAVALVVAAANVQPILTPVSYEVAVISRDDGTEIASLLAVSTTALETDALSQEQKLVWKGLKARIEAQYAGADRRGQARLMVELLKLEGANRWRGDNSVWLRFPGDATTHLEYFGYPRNGSLWRVTDPATGQYLAIVKYEDFSTLMPMYQEMFDSSSPETVVPRVRAEQERLAKLSEAMVEVNGQRQYLAKGTATPAALAAEMLGLLPNLYGEGRSRILESVAIAEAFRSGALKADGPALVGPLRICAAPCDTKALPLPAIPATLTTKITASRGAFLEPVEDEVAKEFFRNGQWPQPDLDLAFAEQVRKLLSAKE
jgi:hypothetical protein